MNSRFQAFGASVMAGLREEESVRLPRGVLVVGAFFVVGTLVALGAACLSLL